MRSHSRSGRAFGGAAFVCLAASASSRTPMALHIGRLYLPYPLEEGILLRRDHRPAHDVAVPGYVLRRGVNNRIRAHTDGLLEHRCRCCHKRTAHPPRAISAVRRISVHRIRRCFHPDKACVGLYRLPHLRWIGNIRERNLQERANTSRSSARVP